MRKPEKKDLRICRWVRAAERGRGKVLTRKKAGKKLGPPTTTEQIRMGVEGSSGNMSHKYAG